MATSNRAGEQGSVPARHGRYLQKEGYWYYATREGVDIGPFDSREDAETGVGEFVDFIIVVVDFLFQHFSNPLQNFFYSLEMIFFYSNYSSSLLLLRV